MKELEYTYPVEDLYTGSSLGNLFTFARLDRETNLRGLWSASDNLHYLGEWNIGFTVDSKEARPVATEFEPASQATCHLAEGVEIEKRFFVPFIADDAEDHAAGWQRTGIYLITLKNGTRARAEVCAAHKLALPAVPSNLFTKQPPEAEYGKRFDVSYGKSSCEVTTIGAQNEARVIGGDLLWTKFAATDLSVEAECRIQLGAQEVITCVFAVSWSHLGIEDALRGFRACLQGPPLLDRSRAEYRKILGRSLVFTPEPVINRGVQWAKVNMVRVQHRYKIGDGFTNDPPQDVVVIRDVAWYVLGSDYLTPDFSRNLLELGRRFAYHPDGKLTEFIRANEAVPDMHDYKLNINDDTPLYAYALWHHALTGADDYGIERAFPLMRKACNAILSQMREGLVHCTATGTNVWGICGWRNIIDNYNLTGAVTEINAECYYALKITSLAAAAVGEYEDSARFAAAAVSLREAINTRLVSEKNGMYLLNVDQQGISHHDITGDLIFPVMFRVTLNGTREKILSKLTDDDMWQPYGTRTVSSREANYDPEFGYQLVGGLWHNLTAWISYCIRGQNPDKMKEGMVIAYSLSETGRPADFINVVPGEFPERLHGENFTSRGMAMSPWMPPTYLWLAIEGLLGLESHADKTEMNPALPSGWTWVAVKDLVYRGGKVSAFFCEGTLYSSIPVESVYPKVVGSTIETTCDNPEIFDAAIDTGEELVLFAASDDGADGTIKCLYGSRRIEQHVSLVKGAAVLFHYKKNQ